MIGWRPAGKVGAAVLAGFAVAIGLEFGAARVLGLRPATGTPLSRLTARFQTGVNVYSLTDYGQFDASPTATVGDQEADLREMQRIGATVVRVIPALSTISADEAASRLDRFLTKADQYGVSAIVSLTNFYGDSRLYPRGTGGFYNETWHGIPYLSHTFVAGGYRAAYLDFVRTVVTANRSHLNIYAWEPGNEFQDAEPAAIIGFMRDTTELIKQLDPSHPVAAGMTEAQQTGLTPEQLYPNVPALDYVTVHPGNGYRASAADVDWALGHGKAAIVEEMAFSGRDDRSLRIEREIDFWKQKGAAAVLLDGFIARGLGDTGSGEQDLGFDDIWHTDYDAIVKVLQRSSG